MCLFKLLILMKIRATNKLLKIAKINALTDNNELPGNLPGEWYAAPVSLLLPGKIAIQCLHFPTFISTVLQTKSLNKVQHVLKENIESLLFRHGYDPLIPYFDLDSEVEIFKTNSRSMLAHLNQLKFHYEYHFSRYSVDESIDFKKLEDINMDYLFGYKKEYITPIRVLDKLLKLIEK